MAQESISETLDSNDRSVSPNKTSSPSSDPSLSRNGSFSRLNAQAPEFVPSPRSSVARPDLAQPRLTGPSPPMLHVVHVPIQHHMVNQQHHYRHHHVPSQYQHHSHQHHHQQQNHNNHNHHRQQQQYQSVQTESDHAAASRNELSDETAQKIVNQVDYYFSDLNLATTDHLMRFISKDPEGYVPISIVSAFKKIKALISSKSQLATILHNSSKLLVSEDGKKVKRQHPFTESDMEELQSRIVIAENLPEDHCHQNLMKIFSAIGSVKAIRTCQPPTSNNGGGSSASRPGKGEGMLFSNKLHAFVEYETIELAEKAVDELNDEGNWRSGLRVRLMLRRGSKPIQAPRAKKGHDGEEHYDEDDNPLPEQHQQPAEKPLEDFSEQIDTHLHDHQNQMEEENGIEKDNGGGQRKGRGGRGRGRGGRGRNNPYHHNNNNHNRVNNHPIGINPVTSSNHHHNVATDSSPTVAKQPPGPRMPDGTRGFAMGRGKPLAVSSMV